MTDAPQTRSGSDMTIRFAAGIAMIAVAAGVTLLGGWFFRVFALALTVLMLVEWADMKKVPRLWAWAGGALAALVLLGAAQYFYPTGYDPEQDEIIVLTWLSFAPALAGAVLLGLASRSLAMGWGFLYIVLPAYCLVVLSWASADTMGELVFWVLVVTWATDIFAYFAGRAIGGPKLAPAISPNKTWAGLIGGVIGAAALGWAFATWFEMPAFFLYAGGPLAVAAQAGDLFESWLKRRAGIKDSGSLLPGHGGVLDRLDGLLAVSLVTTLLLMAGFWTE
jgi:phosphatidate cytidylyltransferase